MLTVTIQNKNATHISVREWPSVDVIKEGCERFTQEMLAESVRLEDELELSADDVVEYSGRYKAILRSVCGEFAYFMVDDEEAYITNQSGKTIAVVK